MPAVLFLLLHRRRPKLGLLVSEGGDGRSGGGSHGSSELVRAQRSGREVHGWHVARPVDSVLDERRERSSRRRCSTRSGRVEAGRHALTERLLGSSSARVRSCLVGSRQGESLVREREERGRSRERGRGREVVSDLLGEVSGREPVVNGRSVGRVEGGASSGGFRVLKELLGVLPDLRRVRSEREPESNQVGLHVGKRNTREGQSPQQSRRERRREGETDKQEDSRADVHEVLDGRLVERVLGRVRVRVVAALAHPRLSADRPATREPDLRVRASTAAELELVGRHGESKSASSQP